MIGYSKAFDTVNHEVLVRKLQQFALPGNILKWIASSLLDRSQTLSQHRLMVSVHCRLTSRVVLCKDQSLDRMHL